MWLNNILETIGNTPLIRLNKITKDLPATVVAKVDYFNPGNSIKDRMALKMVEVAEQEGKLKPGGTIIEGTSGNTGMGLALAACVKGYKCIFVTTDKQSKEKADILKAVGAEVIVCPTNVLPDDPKSYYSVAKRLATEIPNSMYMNQYDNLANRLAHYETTGPEIWNDTGGKVDVLISGVGTGGSLTGAGGFLKDKNPAMHIIALEPEGSPVLSKGEKGPHMIQGIGAGFVPDILDTDLIDEIVVIDNETAFATARRAAKLDGVPVGISSGAAIAAALEVGARKDMADKTIVTIIPSFAERYLSTALFDF